MQKNVVGSKYYSEKIITAIMTIVILVLLLFSASYAVFVEGDDMSNENNSPNESVNLEK